jgi:2-polyprenyl-3-methyl-5-hydroxy-6-metoxy-1,4-benzoquinol methylase
MVVSWTGVGDNAAMGQDSATFWNRKAAAYEAKLPTRGANYAARLARAGAVMSSTDRVLDVGCATGQITRDLAGQCGSILGIDTAEAMIEQARAVAAAEGVSSVSFAAIGPGDASLEPGSFDVIVCYSLFHLVGDDWPAMVRRMHDLLRPGGHVLNETPCLGDWGWWWRPVLWAATAAGAAPPVGRIKVAELEAAFRGAGFDILDSRVHNPKSGQHGITARKQV